MQFQKGFVDVNPNSKAFLPQASFIAPTGPPDRRLCCRSLVLWTTLQQAGHQPPRCLNLPYACAEWNDDSSDHSSDHSTLRLLLRLLPVESAGYPDGGKPVKLFESAAIMWYLEEKHGRCVAANTGECISIMCIVLLGVRVLFLGPGF